MADKHKHNGSFEQRLMDRFYRTGLCKGFALLEFKHLSAVFMAMLLASGLLTTTTYFGLFTEQVGGPPKPLAADHHSVLDFFQFLNGMSFCCSLVTFVTATSGLSLLGDRNALERRSEAGTRQMTCLLDLQVRMLCTLPVSRASPVQADRLAACWSLW